MIYSFRALLHSKLRVLLMQLSTSCNEEKILIPGVETNPDLDNRVLLRTGVATNFLSIDIPSLFFLKM
jgi:hypothetical protein